MQDRVALVTGGTKGIGRAIALRLAKDGHRVFVNYSSDGQSAQNTVDELKSISGFGEAVKADVSKPDQVEAMFKEIADKAGRLDVLVNNAGLIKDGMLMMMPDENWRKVMEVNLDGVYFCSKSALRPMVERRGGRIVNIISPSAIMGRQGQCNYSASKGGVLSFTKSLAREMARLGITVNAVSPGVIETELTSALSDKVRSELLGMIPVGRLGSADDVANAVSFIVSDSAKYITGQIIAVDGGIT